MRKGKYKWVKLIPIPPCMLSKFALLTCSASRGINTTYDCNESPLRGNLVSRYLINQFPFPTHLNGLCSNSPVEDFIVECPANLVPKLIDLEQHYLLLHMRPSLVYPQERKREKTHIVSHLVIDCLLIKVCITSHFPLLHSPIIFVISVLNSFCNR